MKTGVKVGDVMSRELVSVKPGISLIDCASEMARKNVGIVFVKNNGSLMGVLTERDIIWNLAENKSLMARASDVAKKRSKVVTINPDEDVYNALIKMRKKKVRCLPVTVKDRVIGMITVKDILRIEPSLFDIAAEMTPIREETEKMKEIKMRRNRDSLAQGDIWIKEGECHECGAYGLLYNLDGRLICEECKDEA